MLANKQPTENDLELLSWASREAGEIAMSYFRKTPKVWMKFGNSLVSEADCAVDSFLKRELLAARPNYGWISEESGDDRIADSYCRFFVVDPIDGTRGFIDWNTRWCVSIAVIENGRPIAGVLECPAKKEHFLAEQGKPALLNGEIIRVALPDSHRRLLIYCHKSIIKSLPASLMQSVTTFGMDIPSLAYRLALLSSGRLDAVFVRSGCHDWDIAAADIILKQSGGMLVGMTGHPILYNLYNNSSFFHGFLLACRNEIFQSMLDVARKAELD